MSGPIKPSEVRAHKTATIPEEVFVAFNDCISLAWDGRSATVLQKEVLRRIASALRITEKDVIELHYLNIEESYRSHGWIVEYDKPGHNEMYDAFFRFTSGKV